MHATRQSSEEAPVGADDVPFAPCMLLLRWHSLAKLRMLLVLTIGEREGYGGCVEGITKGEGC